MNDASSSNPPPPPPPTPADHAAAESSLLAPGFRFHPTDEELVSYYLKRKVFNRPLRVDAIAEVELYKAEPWDLPALSRLRSRDMEWYFFSPLDRKYANRSRTNRATSQGYWKTTGKDRPVRRGPRVVGMKKTLVFHAGRAPRGERTNWVMHEYRLEDDELTRAGIPQDAYVVCRIFQKSGSGPQNGAQYGAPFNEEEWEEEGNMALAVVDSGGDADGSPENMPLPPVASNEPAVVAVGTGEYFQLSDFAEIQAQGNQLETSGFLAADSDVHDSSSVPEDDPIFLVQGIFRDQGNADVLNAPGPHDLSSISVDMGGNTGLATQFPSPPSHSDEYFELNDILNTNNVDCPSSEKHVGVDLFDFTNEITDSPAMFQMHSDQNDFYLEQDDLNLRGVDHPSDQATEELFYDASSNDLPFGAESYVRMDDLYSPMEGSCGFSAVDDIASYFDNSCNNSHYSVLNDSSEKFCVDSFASKEPKFSPEVGSTVPKSTQASDAVGASSSVYLPGAGNLSDNINKNIVMLPDSKGLQGCDKTLTKRLVNMLGSISAPPAFAAEFPTSAGKSSGRMSTTNTASSIHVTAGMIQIHGFEVAGRAERWSLHKNGDMGFLLSCGVASSKSNGSESITKIQGCSMSVVLQGGFYLFFISAMFMALCVKVGMRVCSN